MNLAKSLLWHQTYPSGNFPFNNLALIGALSNRIRCLLGVTVGSLATIYVVVYVILGLGIYTWRSEVHVIDIAKDSPTEFTLLVGSCNRDPEVSLIRETYTEVEVKVVADTNAFMISRDDCLDIVEIKLQEPIGDRKFVNKHSGIFNIRNLTHPKSFFPR